MSMEETARAEGAYSQHPLPDAAARRERRWIHKLSGQRRQEVSRCSTLHKYRIVMTGRLRDWCLPLKVH